MYTLVEGNRAHIQFLVYQRQQVSLPSSSRERIVASHSNRQKRWREAEDGPLLPLACESECTLAWQLKQTEIHSPPSGATSS